MRDLNKKAENEVYERAAKDLTIYKEFVEFTKRRLQAAPASPTVILANNSGEQVMMSSDNNLK